MSGYFYVTKDFFDVGGPISWNSRKGSVSFVDADYHCY